MAHRLAIVVASGFVALTAGSAAQDTRQKAPFADIKAVAFSADGNLIAAGGNNQGGNNLNVVFLFDGTSLQFKRAIQGKERRFWGRLAANAVAFTQDDTRLAAVGIDNVAVVWDLSTAQEVLRIPDLKGATIAAFSPRGELAAAAGSGNEVTLWSIPEGKQVGVLVGHTDRVTSLAFSPDAALIASGSADKTVRIWSVAAGKQLTLFEGHPYLVHSLSFSPDATMLAAYAGEARIWQLTDGTALTELVAKVDTSTGMALLLTIPATAEFTSVPGFLHPVTGWSGARFPPLAFSPDGMHLAVMRFNPKWSTDNEVVVVNHATRTTTASIPCQCVAIAFSPDGKRLATAGVRGIQLWDVSSGAQIASSR